MCFYTRQKEERIAKKDIIVFKGTSANKLTANWFSSEYQKYVYTKDFENTPVKLVPVFDNGWDIHEGYHAYKTFPNVKEVYYKTV